MSDKHLHVNAENQIAQSRRIKALEAEASQLRSKLITFTPAMAHRAAKVLHSHFGLSTGPSVNDILLAKHLLLVALTDDRPQSTIEVERMWRDREKA